MIFGWAFIVERIVNDECWWRGYATMPNLSQEEVRHIMVFYIVLWCGYLVCGTRRNIGGIRLWLYHLSRGQLESPTKVGHSALWIFQDDKTFVLGRQCCQDWFQSKSEAEWRKAGETSDSFSVKRKGLLDASDETPEWKETRRFDIVITWIRWFVLPTISLVRPNGTVAVLSSFALCFFACRIAWVQWARTSWNWIQLIEKKWKSNQLLELFDFTWCFWPLLATIDHY